MFNILIVEDEPDIAAHLYNYFVKSNFTPTVLNSGEHVVDTVSKTSPDIILLDIMLPVKSGVICAKEIREFSDVPIIMLTAKNTDIDRIIGLQAGVDDYVCKPFNAKELVLRTEAILRRCKVSPKTSGLNLDTDSLLLHYQNGESVKLTKLEYALFSLLYNRPSRIFSREQVISLAYKDSHDITERAVDSHVKNLRKKIKTLGINQVVIDCIYGVGYQFIPIES
jgi:two-component system response regulator BaeR